MKITRGIIASAKKILIYGPEGIGKSTFASHFPDPVFIDTEGSTKNLNVARFDKPTSWAMLIEQVKYVQDNPEVCKTLVIDTIDWAEMYCIESVCAKHHKNGLESFGYGTGYVYVKEEFGRFLNLLGDICDKGINIVLTAHAQIKKFELPDEAGAYDRYELKLGKKTSSQTSPLVKEWADMVLFANYKTHAVEINGKKKAQGGRRMIFTSHHPCWDAKNRYGLPEEIPMEYQQIAPIIENTVSIQETPIQPVNEPVKKEPVNKAMDIPVENVAQLPEPEEIPYDQAPDPVIAKADTAPPGTIPGVPKELSDLMTANNVSEWDIQAVCARRGYYPEDTPIANYDPDFISGCLVAAWPQVLLMVQQYRDEFNENPFK